MCLSIALHRPDDILEHGEHAGHEFFVIHNGLGHRCGYVRVPPGHPWHGRDCDEIDCNVHGGLTFAEPDTPCPKGEDGGYWVGFDCGHASDLPDPDLPMKIDKQRWLATTSSLLEGFFGTAKVRDQEYVLNECRSLCAQAATAAQQEAL